VPEELYKNVFGLSLWDPEEGNREAAAELVKEIGLENITEFPGWLEPFEEEEVDKEVREAATMVLGEICDGRAVEPLIEALGDENGNVCWRATEALGRIGDARAMEPLIGVLSDGAVRESAAGALDELGWKPDTDELKISYMIATEDWKGCVEMGESAVEPLIKALGDGGAYVREAAYALGEIGDARAFEPLIELLNVDWDDEWICRAAAYALGEIGDARAVEPLIEVLEDENWWARESAAKALGKIGDVRAVEPLIKALGDDYEVVRAAAKEALCKLGHEV
jgi:HEAT repeat protein